MQLDEVQRNLAASLTGRTAPVEGLDPEALDRARRGLEVKRRQAAAHLLPRLRGALGTAWPTRFREHAERYTPSGMLHHVDDAWELAETMLRSLDPRIACAAHDDLVSLRLRFTRDRRAGADRIRERRGPFVALMKTPSRLLVVRMPGPEGRVWYLKV
ncbi:MAG TPA: hypothetical protein VF756_03320 [Thermoanaerobaculia bacterium]